MENKLKEIEERIQQQMKREGMLTPESAPKYGFVYAAKMGLRMGTDLLSGVFVGVAIGYLLDKLFESFPLFLIIFTFIGAVAGVLNVYRFVKQQAK